MSEQNPTQVVPAPRTVDEIGADLLAAKRRQVNQRIKHAAAASVHEAANKDLDAANAVVSQLEQQFQTALTAQATGN